MEKYRKVYININSRCNCKCINCILKESARVDLNILHPTDIENTMKNLENLDNDCKNIVEISGGEPTLHEELLEILKAVKKYKDKQLVYKVALLSNCLTLSNKDFCDEVCKYIDDVTVTLYDTTEETHDMFTQIPGSLKLKESAINNLLINNINVHIKLLVINPSYKNLPNMAKYIVEKWGNKVHVAINGTHFTGDAYANKEKLGLRYTDTVSYIEQALDILIDNKNKVSVFFPICLLDSKYWKYSPRGYKDLIDRSVSVSPKYNFGKADRLLDEFINRNLTCETCKFVKRCNWPWKKYCELYGDEEFIEAKSKLKVRKEVK